MEKNSVVKICKGNSLYIGNVDVVNQVIDNGQVILKNHGVYTSSYLKEIGKVKEEVKESYNEGKKVIIAAGEEVFLGNRDIIVHKTNNYALLSKHNIYPKDNVFEYSGDLLDNTKVIDGIRKMLKGIKEDGTHRKFYISDCIQEINECITEKSVVSEIQDLFESFSEDIEVRICSHCNKLMIEGFIIGEGDEYYCSEDCLYQNLTKEEYNNMYEEDEAYYTEWE